MDRQEIESFAMTADQGDGELTSLEFAMPVTITVRYSETILAGSEEENLSLFAYNAATFNWSRAGCGTVKPNWDENQIVIPICHLSTFGVYGSRPPILYLPLVFN